MSRLTSKRWMTLSALFIAFGSVFPVISQTTESEMHRLVQQFDLIVSDEIISTQATQLSSDFRKQFRTTIQLNTPNIKKYFTTHPTEVMAFRRYVQELINLGVVDESLAKKLVIIAFQSVEMAPKNQELIQSSILTAPMRTRPKTNLDTKQIRPLADKPDEPSNPDLRILDFGESLIEEQETSMAGQELAIKLEEQKRLERNKLLARALINEFSQGKPSLESLGNRVERVMSNFAETETKKQAESLLDNVEISVTAISKGPEYEFRGLKAFDDINPNYFSFAEFGMTTNDDDTTVNIGVGIRKLTEDQTVMGGINAFYDQELDAGHNRGSIGVELISAPFRLNANRYYALSGGYALSSTETEKPLSGYDIDAEVALPYFPGLFAGYNQSTWYGEDGASDVERKIYKLRGSLSNNLSLELGKRTYSSSAEDQNTAKLSYNYVFGKDSAPATLLDFDTQPYRHKKIGPHERYRMVERENKIITQVSSAGLQVTFTAL